MEIDSSSRDNVVKLLSKHIDKKIAKQIEESIFNFTKDYVDSNDTPPYLYQSIYDTKSSDIINEIINKDSNYLINAIKNNTIKISEIAFMKTEDLNPEKYETIIKKKEMEEYKKNNKVGSNAFTCPKCKNSECSVTQKQTRAGDEPPTTFIECLKCGYIVKR